MKLTIKILIGVSVLGIGALLYWWLTRSKSTTAELTTSNNHWAVSDMLQGNQISALAVQVQDRISRDEVMALIAQAPQTIITSPPATVISTGGGPDLDIPISQNGQTQFIISSTETRDKLFLNGVKLEPDEFTLAPPNLLYKGIPILEPSDKFTLSF